MAQTDDPALRDPMFAELRRRHPDVTIVMLPQPPVPEAPHPPTPLAEVQALEQRTRDALDELVHATGREPAGRTTLWWRQGPAGEHRFVARAALTDLTTPLEALGAAYDALEDAGWHVRALADPRARFEGEHGPLSVRAEAYPTAVQLRVTSEVVVLDADALARPGVEL